MHHQVGSVEDAMIITCMANWRSLFDCSSKTSATFYLLLAFRVVLDWSLGERRSECGKDESRTRIYGNGFVFIALSFVNYALICIVYELVSNGLSLVILLNLLFFLLGKGPHVLGSTAVDIYLLPNTYVTLQSVPWKGSSIVIERKTRPRNKQHLLGKNVKEKEITIGPMNEQLNHLVVDYIYKHSEDSKHAIHISSASILHLFC